ncbi:MAG: cytidine/deoxycytidylate deaminase family protein [Chloroflexi bacterium]|nr:cytidine/deoxycytidylate deaminase family protein [Chloroflexota bacterium]
MPPRRKDPPREERISKDEYFLRMAEVVSKRATCDRLFAGAVLVKDGMVLSTGYNGAPRGMPHCSEVGHRIIDGHCVRTIHAEANTIIQAAYHGVSTKGSTLYTQYFPCEYCAKTLINAGVVRVVYRDLYSNLDQPYIKKLFGEAKVEVKHLPSHQPIRRY